MSHRDLAVVGGEKRSMWDGGTSVLGKGLGGGYGVEAIRQRRAPPARRQCHGEGVLSGKRRQEPSESAHRGKVKGHLIPDHRGKANGIAEARGTAKW